MAGSDRRKRRAPANRRLPRRALVRGATGVAVSSLALGTVGSARGQQVTIEAALLESVQTLSGDDHTGVFVDVLEVGSDEPHDALEQCAALDETGTPARWEVRLLDRIQGDHREVGATLFASEDTEIEVGDMFVINRQEPCSGRFVLLELESIEEAEVGTPALPGGSGETVEPGVQNPETTGETLPGFDAVAALLGLATASCCYLWRALRSGDE